MPFCEGDDVDIPSSSDDNDDDDDDDVDDDDGGGGGGGGGGEGKAETGGQLGRAMGGKLTFGPSSSFVGNRGGGEEEEEGFRSSDDEDDESHLLDSDMSSSDGSVRLNE